MARALLPRLADQPDLRGHQRDPADRDRPRSAEEGIVLRRSLGLPGLVLLAFLTACSEEDRRAFVSIRPSSEEEGETADTTASESGSPGELALTADSAAVTLGSDTLFAARRIPRRVPGSETSITRRLTTAILSPDGTTVAFVTVGPDPAVGIWSRARQVAAVVTGYPDGEVDAIAWSPDGRFLAHQGRDAGGFERVGAYDTRLGSAVGHPVLAWLSREDRGVSLTGWRSNTVLGVLVEPPGGDGGLAHVWDLAIERFQLEDHVELLPRLAPPNAFLSPGGVFSLDLIDDEGIETVALYRSAADGQPGSLVLRDGGAGPEIVSTRPLVEAPALGFEKWTDVETGPGLFGIADLGDGPFPMLTMPSSRAPLTAVVFFRPLGDGRLEALEMESPRGTGPAIFYDGRGGSETLQLGLADLDGDRDLEIVRAEAHRDVLAREALWSVEVFDWRGGRLVHDPALQASAQGAIERLGGGGGG